MKQKIENSIPTQKTKSFTGVSDTNLPITTAPKVNFPISPIIFARFSRCFLSSITSNYSLVVKYLSNDISGPID
jgi:hypothetical protein